MSETSFRDCRRVDKTGQSLLSSRSLFLLIRLAIGDAESCGWGTDLRNFKISFGINDLDLEPLVQAGWIGERVSRPSSTGGKTNKSIFITDTGNDVVRGLLSWLKLQADGEVVS
jgi:hypothetical protein